MHKAALLRAERDAVDARVRVVRERASAARPVSAVRLYCRPISDAILAHPVGHAAGEMRRTVAIALTDFPSG
jgi:hypothetical protein